MENVETNMMEVLEYNTHRGKLILPEYGRGVQNMIDHVKTIEDRQKRSEQAACVVRVMSILNQAVHSQEDWEHTLWDHLHIMAGYELDIDAPYPMPQKKEIEAAPAIVPIIKKPIRATHYGRNIESIIRLIEEKEEGEIKTAMILDLASYMRTQYLIWNKDSVSDETIFKDIEKLSDGKIVVPEGLKLAELNRQATFNRPGITSGQKKNRQGRKNGRSRQGRRQ